MQQGDKHLLIGSQTNIRQRESPLKTVYTFHYTIANTCCHLSVEQMSGHTAYLNLLIFTARQLIFHLYLDVMLMGILNFNHLLVRVHLGLTNYTYKQTPMYQTQQLYNITAQQSICSLVKRFNKADLGTRYFQNFKFKAKQLFLYSNKNQVLCSLKETSSSKNLYFQKSSSKNVICQSSSLSKNRKMF